MSLRRPLSALAAALTLAVTLGACSTGGSGSASLDPAKAADTVATAFELPAAQRDCLATRFQADRAAADQIATGTKLDQSALDRLAAILDGCIDRSTFGDAVAKSMATGFPKATQDQLTCVHDQVVALDQKDRRDLMAGLVALNTIGTSQAAVRLGDITNSLFAACKIDPSQMATSGTTVVPPAGG